MDAPDPNWANVRASITQMDLPPHPDGGRMKPAIMFSIDVPVSDTVWWSWQIAAERDLEEDPYLYGLILDMMVKSIDERMQEDPSWKEPGDGESREV